jgi:hypothetical protein
MRAAGNILLPFRSNSRGMGQSGGIHLLDDARGPGREQSGDPKTDPSVQICSLEKIIFIFDQQPSSARKAAGSAAGLQAGPQAGPQAGLV